MKTRILLFGMALSLLTIGCNKDDDKTAAPPMTSNEVAESAKMDNISDDITQIAEYESNASESGRGGSGFFGPCASISTTVSGNIWTRTIDFGATNCALWNGNQVRGKIIITFTDDFAATTRTISYSFDNFYHNDRHVEGNRTVIRTIINGIPTATISLDLTVTTPTGDVYHRVGQKVREFTQGSTTFFNFADDVFSYTGNWVTTFPSGNVSSATVTSPVIVQWGCLYITQGTIVFTRNGGTAVLDYGNGNCDNQATITINGTPHNITLGLGW